MPTTKKKISCGRGGCSASAAAPLSDVSRKSTKSKSTKSISAVKVHLQFRPHPAPHCRCYRWAAVDRGSKLCNEHHTSAARTSHLCHQAITAIWLQPSSVSTSRWDVSTIFPMWASKANFSTRVCRFTSRMADSAHTTGGVFANLAFSQHQLNKWGCHKVAVLSASIDGFASLSRIAQR